MQGKNSAELISSKLDTSKRKLVNWILDEEILQKQRRDMKWINVE